MRSLTVVSPVISCKRTLQFLAFAVHFVSRPACCIDPPECKINNPSETESKMTSFITPHKPRDSHWDRTKLWTIRGQVLLLSRRFCGVYCGFSFAPRSGIKGIEFWNCWQSKFMFGNLCRYHIPFEIVCAETAPFRPVRKMEPIYWYDRMVETITGYTSCTNRCHFQSTVHHFEKSGDFHPYSRSKRSAQALLLRALRCRQRYLFDSAAAFSRRCVRVCGKLQLYEYSNTRK